MLQNLGRRHPIETLESVADGSIPLLAEQVWQVHVDDSIRNYIVALTRPRAPSDLTLGASPRRLGALSRGTGEGPAGAIVCCPTTCRRWRRWPAPPLHRQARRVSRPYRPAIVADLVEQTPLDLGDVHDR